MEDRELLKALYQKLQELDPDGRRICELIMQGQSVFTMSTFPALDTFPLPNGSMRMVFHPALISSGVSQ